MASPITITFVSGKFFVWDGDAIYKLRTTHRICGQLVGALPWKPWQSGVHSSPLILSPCEAHFCFKNGIAEIVNGKNYFSKRKLSEEEIDEYEEKKQCNQEEQIKIFIAEREEKKKLYYGRKKKGWKKKKGLEARDGESEPVNEEQDVEKSEDCIKVNHENVSTSDNDTMNFNDVEQNICKNDNGSNIIEINPNNINQQLDHNPESNVITTDDAPSIIDKKELEPDKGIKWENIELSEEDIQYYNGSVRVHIPSSVVDVRLFEKFSSNYPMTEKEKCKCIVFEDIHKRGYYTTSALKFGGDFLVYLGDPLRHHSHYIVLVLERNQILSVKDMITYGRLAAAVKKTVVLATLNEDFSCVEYLSLTWAQMK